MADCSSYPVHPWQYRSGGNGQQGSSGGGGGGGGGSVYPSDGTLPGHEFRQVKRVTVLIDSRDRDYAKNPSPSEYVVFLPEAIHNVSNAVLISAEMPSTYYVFSAAKANTSLVVTADGTTQTITVPDGNYTFTTLASALDSALESAFPGITFVVAFNEATARCSITASPSNTVLAVDCTAATRPTGWGLGYYLGFAKGVVTSGTGTVTGTSVANTNPETYMLVDIDELNAVSQAAIYSEGSTMGKVFAKVPICNSSFQYSFYDKTLICNEVRPPRARLDRLSISIKFHDGTLVDFHGAEHSLTIELTCTLTR